MEIVWLTAFVDLPAATFARGAAFWEAVSGTTRSEQRGGAGEFATLAPATGDPHLRVQLVGDREPRIHLDFHVDDAPAAARHAVEVGATKLDDVEDWVVLRSPGGFVFCFVTDEGDTIVPAPLADSVPHRVDQVSIDIPHLLWDAECAFWSEVTGWPLHRSALAEFASLEHPAGIPMRVLLHRLGEDDAGTAVRAHLDIACGEVRAVVAEHHRTLGADHVYDGPHWTTLRDPAGLPYCVTRRDPDTSRLPD